MALTVCFLAALSIGTLVSAFTVLCGARTDLPDRHMCCVFWLNIAAALIQILTAIVMVGWIMSIFWGMDMVILASKYSALPLPSTPRLWLCCWEPANGPASRQTAKATGWALQVDEKQ